MQVPRQWISLLAMAALALLFTGTPATPATPFVAAQGGAWIEVVAPGYTSGDDFATVEVGNPWDMDSASDIDRVWTTDAPSSGVGPPVNTTYYVDNGILKISTNDTGYGTDFSHGVPHRPLAFNLGGKTIDTSKYRYFSYRFQLTHAPQSQNRYAYGNVNRVRWYHSGIWAEGRTSDILIPAEEYLPTAPNDWYTYTIDLWSYPHVFAPYKGTAQWNVLQLMFHEANYGWPAQLDWAMLTANNTADGSYTAKWNAHGSISTPYTTTIYWSTQPSQTDVLPQTAQVVPPPGSVSLPPYSNTLFLPIVLKHYNPSGPQLDADFSHTVNTDHLTSGQAYYIAIKITDGVNPDVWGYSEVPVTIQ